MQLVPAIAWLPTATQIIGLPREEDAMDILGTALLPDSFDVIIVILLLHPVQLLGLRRSARYAQEVELSWAPAVILCLSNLTKKACLLAVNARQRTA